MAPALVWTRDEGPERPPPVLTQTPDGRTLTVEALLFPSLEDGPAVRRFVLHADE